MFIPLAVMAVLFMFNGSFEKGEFGLPFLVVGLVLGAAWALPILRGRPALLAVGLVFTGTGLVTLVMQGSIRDNLCASYDFGYSDYATSSCSTDFQEVLTATTRNSSVLTLIFGIGLLVAALTLDRRNWPNLGRVFIGVGVIFELSGAYGVYASTERDFTGASMLLVLAGAVLLAVAVQRNRVASLRIGAIGLTIGIVALILSMTSGSNSPTSSAILLIAAGVGCVILRRKGLASVEGKIKGTGLAA